MRARNFDPWVGNRYEAEGLSGVRVLVLGESHYEEDPDEPSPRSFTQDVVREWGQEKRSRFFTMVQKLLLGLGPGVRISDRERREFWERVAFYNYVQSIVGPRSRHRPTPDMWAAAEGPFLFTLQELDPHVLVVLGFELRRRLPQPKIPSTVRVCCVQHPSSRGFRYEPWETQIRSALHAARAEGGSRGG